MSTTAINRHFGLKWNPFAKDVPDEGLVTLPQVNYFVRRVEQLVDDGGFAMVSGNPGSGSRWRCGCCTAVSSSAGT